MLSIHPYSQPLPGRGLSLLSPHTGGERSCGEARARPPRATLPTPHVTPSPEVIAIEHDREGEPQTQTTPPPPTQPLQSVFLNQDLKRLAAAQAGSAAALRLPAGAGPLRVTACIPNKLPGGSSRLCQELPWIRTSGQPRGSCAHLFAPVSSPATCT